MRTRSASEGSILGDGAVSAVPPRWRFGFVLTATLADPVTLRSSLDRLELARKSSFVRTSFLGVEKGN